MTRPGRDSGIQKLPFAGDRVINQRDEQYISLNVRYVRKHILCVSQEEFAYMVDLSKDTVSNIERGVYIPSVHHLISISNCVNIPIDFFLYEIEGEQYVWHIPNERGQGKR